MLHKMWNKMWNRREIFGDSGVVSTIQNLYYRTIWCPIQYLCLMDVIRKIADSVELIFDDIVTIMRVYRRATHLANLLLYQYNNTKSALSHDVNLMINTTQYIHFINAIKDNCQASHKSLSELNPSAKFIYVLNKFLSGNRLSILPTYGPESTQASSYLCHSLKTEQWRNDACRLVSLNARQPLLRDALSSNKGSIVGTDPPCLNVKHFHKTLQP